MEAIQSEPTPNESSIRSLSFSEALHLDPAPTPWWRQGAEVEEKEKTGELLEIDCFVKAVHRSSFQTHAQTPHTTRTHKSIAYEGIQRAYTSRRVWHHTGIVRKKLTA